MAGKINTPDITAEQARALLRYEPDTGRLYWRSRPRDMFRSDREWKRWNTLYADKSATNYRGNAKRFVTLKSGKVSAGRIIWLMLHGEWPSKPVLHDNGKRSDNRECNLRQGYVE